MEDRQRPFFSATNALIPYQSPPWRGAAQRRGGFPAPLKRPALLLRAVSSSLQCRHNLSKTGKSGLQVFNDFGCQLLRLRQIIKVGQTFVFEPKNIQAGFIPSEYLVIRECTPPPLRVRFRVPGFPPSPTVLWVIALDKILQVFKALIIFSVLWESLRHRGKA